jgi:hypothetical protein
MIVVDAAAPAWAHELARRIDEEIAARARGPFLSLTTIYDAAGSLPDPAKNDGKIILLKNGTYWLAKSIGGAWTYPNNAAV